MPRYTNLLGVISYRAEDDNDDNSEAPGDDSHTVDGDSETVGGDPRSESIDGEVDQILTENESRTVAGDFESQTGNDVAWDVPEDRLMSSPLSETDQFEAVVYPEEERNAATLSPHHAVSDTSLPDADASISVSDNDLGDLHDYENVYNRSDGFAAGHVDDDEDDEDLWDLYDEAVSYFGCLSFG